MILVELSMPLKKHLPLTFQIFCGVRFIATFYHRTTKVPSTAKNIRAFIVSLLRVCVRGELRHLHLFADNVLLLCNNMGITQDERDFCVSGMSATKNKAEGGCCVNLQVN